MFGLGGFHLRDDTKDAKPDGLDSAAAAAAAQIGTADLDAVALNAEIQDIRKNALVLALQLIDDIAEKDLDDAELATDRLDSLIAGALGIDSVDDESELLGQLLSANIADVFESLGVEVAVAEAMFSDAEDEANAAIEAACETALSNLPSEGDDLNTFIKEFIYGYSAEFSEDDADDETDGYDAAQKRMPSATLGKAAVRKNQFGQKLRYRGVKVIRFGQVKVVNQRLKGQKAVRLSPKQKAALRKAVARAHTSSAVNKRRKSWNKGKRMGLYPTSAQ